MSLVNIFPYTATDEERIEIVAQIAHAANYTYCQLQKQYEIPKWFDAPEETRVSAREGIQKIIDSPGITPEECHENWMAFKFKQGWAYAPGIRDYEKKTHPCLRPYDQLSYREKLKDVLFFNIVKTFLGGP